MEVATNRSEFSRGPVIGSRFDDVVAGGFNPPMQRNLCPLPEDIRHFSVVSARVVLQLRS
jgi:hypothetical protein